MAGGEYVVARGNELWDQVTGNEAGGAGDKDGAHAHTLGRGGNTSVLPALPYSCGQQLVLSYLELPRRPVHTGPRPSFARHMLSISSPTRQLGETHQRE